MMNSPSSILDFPLSGGLRAVAELSTLDAVLAHLAERSGGEPPTAAASAPAESATTVRPGPSAASRWARLRAMAEQAAVTLLACLLVAFAFLGELPTLPAPAAGGPTMRLATSPATGTPAVRLAASPAVRFAASPMAGWLPAGEPRFLLQSASMEGRWTLDIAKLAELGNGIVSGRQP